MKKTCVASLTALIPLFAWVPSANASIQPVPDEGPGLVLIAVCLTALFAVRAWSMKRVRSAAR